MKMIFTNRKSVWPPQYKLLIKETKYFILHFSYMLLKLLKINSIYIYVASWIFSLTMIKEADKPIIAQVSPKFIETE